MVAGVVMVTWPHVISSEIIKLAVVTMKWNMECGDVFSLFVNESRQLTVVFCLLLISVVFNLSIHRKNKSVLRHFTLLMLQYLFTGR